MPFVVAAVPQTVSAATFGNQICQPDPVTHIGSVSQCINNIYIVAVAAAGFAGVILFAAAGYMYMIGTSEMVGKAKKIVTSVIVGMLILFGTYAILNTINPNLTNLSLSIPVVTCTAGSCPPAANVAGPTPAPATATTLTGSCNQSFGLTVSPGCTIGSNCVDVSSYTPTHDCSSNGGVCLLSAQAADRAQTFIQMYNQISGGCSLSIEAAIEGATCPSISSCHSNGTCVDFHVIPSSVACQQDFYQAAQTSGTVVSFQNEYQASCVAASTTGGNIHTNF